MRQRLAALHRRPFDRAQFRALERSLGRARLLARIEAKVRRAPDDPAWTILYARALVRAGRPEEAATALASVAGRTKRFEPGATLLRAEALERAGDLDGALAVLDAGARTTPAVLRARLALAERAGRPRAALAAARALAERVPSRAAWEKVARLALAAGESGVMDEAFERARAHASGAARAEVDLAWSRALVRAGRPDRAAERAMRAAAARRGTAARREALGAYVTAMRAAGRLDEAERRLADLTRRDPGDVAALHLLGLVRLELGADGRTPLAAAHRLAPRDPQVRAAYVTALLEAGDLDAAHRLAAGIRIRSAADVEQILEVADRLYAAGRVDRAAALADRVAARRRRDGATMAALVDFWNVRGEEARALAVARAWAEARPRDPRALVALGEQLHALGERNEAISVWARLPKVVRPSHAGRARFAELLADHGHLYRAIAELRAAIQRAPEEPAYHRLMAILRERGGQDDAALGHWRVVLETARGPAGATMRREARTRIVDLLFAGRLANRRRTLDVETRRLARVLAAGDPLDEALEAGRLLAEIHARAGRHDEAVAIRRQLADLQPGDPQAIEDLARALRRAGRPDEAARVLARRPARSDVERAERDGELALLSVDAGRLEQAIARARRAAVATGRADPLLAVGARLEERGDLDGAARAYAAAIDAGIEAGRGRLALARVDLLRGRRDAATAALLRVAGEDAPDSALAAGRLLLDAGLVPPARLLSRVLDGRPRRRAGGGDAFVLELAARTAPLELRRVASDPARARALDAVLRRAIRAGAAAERSRAADLAVVLGRSDLARDLLRAAEALETPRTAPEVTRKTHAATRFRLLRAAASVGAPEEVARIAEMAAGRPRPGSAPSPRTAAWALALAEGERGPWALLEAASARATDPVLAPACLAIVRLSGDRRIEAAADLAAAGTRAGTYRPDREVATVLCPLAAAAARGPGRYHREDLASLRPERAARTAFALGVAGEPTDEVLRALLRRALGPDGIPRDAAVGALRRLFVPDLRRPLPPPEPWAPYARAAGLSAPPFAGQADFAPKGRSLQALVAWLTGDVLRARGAPPLPPAALHRIERLLPAVVAAIARDGTPGERAALARRTGPSGIALPELADRPLRPAAGD